MRVIAAAGCALPHTCRNFCGRVRVELLAPENNRQTSVKFAPKQSGRVAANVNVRKPTGFAQKIFRICAMLLTQTGGISRV
jgi:hypothetical protein